VKREGKDVTGSPLFSFPFRLLAPLLQSAQLLDDLALGGEAALFFLGEELPVIGGDDEDAAGAAHELGLDAEVLPDLGRQTGGAGEVVSNAAVVDSNVH
jgi:hypothetical protein